MKDLSSVISCNSNLGNPYFLSEEFWKPVLNYVFDNHLVLLLGVFAMLGIFILFLSSVQIFFYKRVPRNPDSNEEENNYDLIIG